MATTQELLRRLDEIQAEINETQRRLPAHSVKPVMMAALFELEDERDIILKQLKTIDPGLVKPCSQA